MMLSELVAKLTAIEHLPIEVNEIVEQLTEMGFQDEIFFFEADTDPTKIRGAFHQFTYRKGVYSEPTLVTHIVYSANVPLEWRRVIAAKELVHIFDSVPAKTDTEDEVSQLLDKLVGPLSSEDYGFADLQAAKDRLALYQALPLLLPDAALKKARSAVEDGLVNAEDVADWACMPLELVKLMLSEDWVALNGALDVL